MYEYSKPGNSPLATLLFNYELFNIEMMFKQGQSYNVNGKRRCRPSFSSS